ncbi:MAG: formimidoylglutamate deiminase [Nocardioidaceae bacterium]
MTGFWCAHAAVGADLRIERAVRIDVAAGRITGVDAGAVPAAGLTVLDGLVVGGLANCHSHAFHRALRGRTNGGDSFWSWREQMYALAAVLDPELMHRLARAVYREMALAGITCVGEFHYLHHGPDGTPYDDPNAMAEALVEAARDAGITIALLDTCYLAAGFGEPPTAVQRRFSDGDADRWAARVSALHARYAGASDVTIGAAIHSVRAVPADQLPVVADWAREHEAPLHVHLSEQPAENAACLARHGTTPTALLAAAGVWGPATTAVHATHLTDGDVTILGAAGAYICFCPTTERDLADGVGPSVALRAGGARLTLGTDSHAVVDLLEEMRAVELDERLVSGRRGSWPAPALLAAGTGTAHASLGFGGAGTIEPGARADLVHVAWDSVRLAGAPVGLDALVFAAGAADVRDVVVAGERLVSNGIYASGEDVPAELAAAIDECWRRAR